MLAESKTIRDIGRALPVLVSGPDLGVPVSADLLDAHATALREQYDSLFRVLDRAGNTLAEAIKTRDPEETADPDGEGARAMERAEAYFKDRREKLRQLRDAFVEVGASSSHDVFDALDHLDNLYLWTVATMQEVRWSVLIADGVSDRADASAGHAFASASAWLASLDEE